MHDMHMILADLMYLLNNYYCKAALSALGASVLDLQADVITLGQRITNMSNDLRETQ